MKLIQFNDENQRLFMKNGIYLFADYRYELTAEYLAEIFTAFLENGGSEEAEDDDEYEGYFYMEDAITYINEELQYLYNPNYTNDNIVIEYALIENDSMLFVEQDDLLLFNFFFLEVEDDISVQEFRGEDGYTTKEFLKILKN